MMSSTSSVVPWDFYSCMCIAYLPYSRSSKPLQCLSGSQTGSFCSPSCSILMDDCSLVTKENKSIPYKLPRPPFPLLSSEVPLSFCWSIYVNLDSPKTEPPRKGLRVQVAYLATDLRKFKREGGESEIRKGEEAMKGILMSTLWLGTTGVQSCWWLSEKQCGTCLRSVPPKDDIGGWVLFPRPPIC